MDSLDIYPNNCRICLEEPAVLDWNEKISDFYDTTYKCCYFIYTNLDEVSDDFSQMLCETCASDLKNAHFLIQKALKSHKILQLTFPTKIDISDEVDIDIQHQQIVDNVDFETVLEPIKISKNFKEHNRKKSKVRKRKVETHKDLPEDLEKIVHTLQTDENLNNTIHEKKRDSTTKVRNKKSLIMCPYCSKLVTAVNIKLHEATHKADRERTVICPKCGIKLYDKRTLYSHMATHKKNREKKHKCEFCVKPYYTRGGLRIHQRLHLGQMKPCPICSKEFYRQIDLDRHIVKTHSASLDHTNVNKPKYYVECKDCSKSILSSLWKYHRETHLNVYQMQCTLCDKHFVSKYSCHKHVSQTHKKSKEDFDKVILYYGENIDARTSHLMIDQTEKLKSITVIDYHSL